MWKEKKNIEWVGSEYAYLQIHISLIRQGSNSKTISSDFSSIFETSKNIFLVISQCLTFAFSVML
jgi:hypothetical protein